MNALPLMGAEAIALGAIHAGLSCAYAYPGTPSTEIMETLLEHAPKESYKASWCSNEKTSYEAALGASLAGKRAMVSMKHVGLNVAMDPFVNSALLKINGGLVVVVADDPGMHSSQDEQDSRALAQFARVPCLEPNNQQEAYTMTRLAFDLSEEWHVPIMIRIVTRLAHGRGSVLPYDRKNQNTMHKPENRMDWILMPAVARKRWHLLLEAQKEFLSYSNGLNCNPLTLTNKNIGVITTGIALEYFNENVGDLKEKPSHLHVGFYPLPVNKIKELAAYCKKIIVIEEGYPVLEHELRGILETPIPIEGKETGLLPYEGELNPEIVRKALGLEAHEKQAVSSIPLPSRPPQLCMGCPHIDSLASLKEALKDYPTNVVTSDIGCYTLSALPPYEAIESTVDMGASIGMARGASEAGLTPAVAVLGDSTFLHSGISPLVDCVSANANITLLILDNETVGMTGAQETIIPSSRLQGLIKGLGIDSDHFHIIDAHRMKHEENVAIFKKELAYTGLSVIIAVRECLEHAKKVRKA